MGLFSNFLFTLSPHDHTLLFVDPLSFLFLEWIFPGTAKLYVLDASKKVYGRLTFWESSYGIVAGRWYFESPLRVYTFDSGRFCILLLKVGQGISKYFGLIEVCTAATVAIPLRRWGGSGRAPWAYGSTHGFSVYYNFLQLFRSWFVKMLPVAQSAASCR